MNYKEKLYQTALDSYFKKDAYTAGEVKEAVDIVIGDDGMRSKEVLEVVKELKKKGIKDVLVVGGGTIPEEDKKSLEKSGVTGNFGPGTSLVDVISHIRNGVSKLRKL